MDCICYPHRQGMLGKELCYVLVRVAVVFVNIVLAVVCVEYVSELTICSRYSQPLG